LGILWALCQLRCLKVSLLCELGRKEWNQFRIIYIYMSRKDNTIYILCSQNWPHPVKKKRVNLSTIEFIKVELQEFIYFFVYKPNQNSYIGLSHVNFECPRVHVTVRKRHEHVLTDRLQAQAKVPRMANVFCTKVIKLSDPFWSLPPPTFPTITIQVLWAYYLTILDMI